MLCYLINAFHDFFNGMALRTVNTQSFEKFPSTARRAACVCRLNYCIIILVFESARLDLVLSPVYSYDNHDSFTSLPSLSQVRVRFANGPLFRVKEPDKVTTVATFQTEMRGKKNNFPAIMKGSPAIVMGRSGRGHVCLMSPHLFEGEPASFAHSRNLFRLCSGSAFAIGRDPTVASLQVSMTGKGQGRV